MDGWPGLLVLVLLGCLAYYYFVLWFQYNLGACRCDENEKAYSGHLDGGLCFPDCAGKPCHLPHACICCCFLLCPNPWWDRKTMKAAWQRRAEVHILERNSEPVWGRTLSGRILKYIRGEQPIPLLYLNTGPRDGSVATVPATVLVNDGGPNAPEAPATLVMTRTRSGRLMAPLTGRPHAPLWQLPTAFPAANLNDKDNLAQINVTVHGAPIAPPGPCYQPTGGVPSEPSAPPMPSAHKDDLIAPPSPCYQPSGGVSAEPSAPPVALAPPVPKERGLEDVLVELSELLNSGAITLREFQDRAYGVEDAIYEIREARDNGVITQAEFEAKLRGFAGLYDENPAKFRPTRRREIGRIRRETTGNGGGMKFVPGFGPGDVVQGILELAVIVPFALVGG